MTMYSVANTCAGCVLLRADQNTLTSIDFRTPDLPIKVPDGWIYTPEHPALSDAKRWLSIYEKGSQPDFTPVLAPAATPFQAVIREIVCRIPFGETRTYGQIAAEAAAMLGRERMSAQAVGHALGSNPFPIIVPCHRVIGADGSLTGYKTGIIYKARLLEHEGVLIR